MKFSKLPDEIQGQICYNIHGMELWELSSKGEEKLDTLTNKEMFNSWLEYQGIIGHTDSILEMHKILFGEGRA